MSPLDPVLLALVQNRLDHISRQMGWVMTRTARSPVFSQSHDFSCLIADAGGTLVSQADGIPIHTGGGGFAVRAVLRDFGKDLRDGDVFLLNDPYTAGGNHLPDWMLVRPVFVAGRHVAFVCNRAHQSDIGGGAAGTYNSAATEIFHEGIRLPVLRLIEAGTLREDLWQLLMINTRTPDLLDGDLRAMIGSTRIGAGRVAALVEELGIETAESYFAGILDYADRRLRAALATLPEGVYEAVETIDNDCFETKEIAIRVKLTLRGGRLSVDFSGSDAQMRGFKNSSLANTYSAVYMALLAFFEPDLPRNEGAFRSVDIVAPEGTVVNPRAPAPVTMCTVFIAHEIIHVVWRALAKAAPERSCAGWGKNIAGVTSGYAKDGRRFVLYHWSCMPGGGAVEGRDGFAEIGHLIALGGLTLPNAEVYEQLYPVRVLKQELRCDAAGAGQYRGGPGVDYVIEVDAPADYSFRAEGLGAPSGFGVRGGGWGAGGRMVLKPKEGAPVEAPKYGVRGFPPLRLEASSPGGGGWGDPRDREPAKVLCDVRDGIVSEAAAREIYGVVIEGGAIDEAETARVRRNAPPA